jgi:hypothetical protein
MADLSDALIEEVRFAMDSPLERAGFEPSVPREGLAEDRDDGLPFRGQWRRKMSAEE